MVLQVRQIENDVLLLILELHLNHDDSSLRLGTPIWFGFGNLDLDQSSLIEISYKGGIALAFSAYLLMPFVLMYACSWKLLRQNFVFFFLSLTTCVGPSLGLSFAAYEFPSLIGGMIGCCLTSILIFKKVGLKDYVDHDVKKDEASGRSHPMDAENEATSPDDASETKKVDIAGTVGPNNSIHIDEGGQEETGESNGESVEIPQKPVEEPDVEEPETGKFQKSSSSSFNMDEEKSSMRASDRAIEVQLGERKKVGEGYVKELIGRTFPLWGTVLILIITRVPQIGLRSILTAKEPSFSIFFQTYGTFKCSASLVLQLENILTYPNLNWKYELLYVPSLIPFALVSFITMGIYRKDLQSSPGSILGVVIGRLKNPAVALFGALILVQLMINGGSAAPATIIGGTLSEAFKEGWIVVAALIGALGSFFSGSTTISNLTFGEIQQIAAETIGLDSTAMLALQAAGGSAGNGVCLVRLQCGIPMLTSRLSLNLQISCSSLL
jgi:L-lactate permease